MATGDQPSRLHGRGLRRTTLAVAVAAAALGAAAEWVAYDLKEVRSWAPDLAVGWALVACGLAVRRFAPRGASGALLCGAGLAWFAGNFAAADVPLAAWLAEHGAYVHRALLAHAVLAFPSGRLVDLPRRTAVAALYVASLSPVLATNDAAWVGLAAVVLGVGVTAGGRTAAPGAAAFAASVGGIAALRLAAGPLDQDALLLLYEAGLVVTGSALLVAAATRASASAMTDRVVELGETVSWGSFGTGATSTSAGASSRCSCRRIAARRRSRPPATSSSTPDR
jgi:hypothetical protein